MHLARFAARAFIGGLFIGHGTQKLFGWFGGPGMEGTEGMMRSLRLYPTRRNAFASGATEAAGGVLLVAGLATPAATAALTGVMATAIRTVHLPNGFWNANGGYELTGTLIAALTALAETGPGNLSLDAVIGRKMSGPWWALGSLVTGAAASAAVVALGRQAAPPEVAGPDPSADGTGTAEA
jgi:putative oxidoreductase